MKHNWVVIRLTLLGHGGKGEHIPEKGRFAGEVVAVDIVETVPDLRLHIRYIIIMKAGEDTYCEYCCGVIKVELWMSVPSGLGLRGSTGTVTTITVSDEVPLPAPQDG